MSNIKEVFRRYEELKAAIKDAETQIEALKPQILEAIPEGKDVKGEYGTFHVQLRPTWKFSATHKAMKEDLKKLEDDEKAKGIAMPSYASILVYTTDKE